MKQVGKVVSWVLTLMLAVTAIASATSWEQGTKNVLSWLSGSGLAGIPSAIASVSASPRASLAVGLFLGALVGWRLKKRFAAGSTMNKTESLGLDMSLMGHSLEEMRSPGSVRVVSELNVLLNRLNKAGFATPRAGSETMNVPTLIQYLHQVGAYLRAGDVASAKAVATDISKDHS